MSQDTSSTSASDSGSRSGSCVRRKKSYILRFKPEWKWRFLMWPAEDVARVETGKDEDIICVICSKRMKANCSTANRHQERNILVVRR